MGQMRRGFHIWNFQRGHGCAERVPVWNLWFQQLGWRASDRGDGQYYQSEWNRGPAASLGGGSKFCCRGSRRMVRLCLGNEGDLRFPDRSGERFSCSSFWIACRSQRCLADRDGSLRQLSLCSFQFDCDLSHQPLERSPYSYGTIGSASIRELL